MSGFDGRGGKVRRLELRGDLFRMLEFAECARPLPLREGFVFWPPPLTRVRTR
jgi:hypothetical protein